MLLSSKFETLIIKRRLILCCFLSAFAMISIFSYASFLYPFHEGVDVNCFFTVGKGMMQGKVVYRDLFEQKGILLYFLYGLASLISYRTFIGVFVLEIIAATTFLYFSARLSKLFLEEKVTLFLIPVLAVLVYGGRHFVGGGEAEEYCLPMLVAGLYYFFRHFKNKEDLSRGIILANGLMAGCVLWIKYTMLGFWFAWILAISISLLLKKKIGKAFLYCAYYLSGMLIATIPWIIYFAVNTSLYDWLNTYFYMNTTLYANFAGLRAMIGSVWYYMSTFTITTKQILISGIFGVVGFIGTNKLIRGVWAKISLLLLLGSLAFGVYCGGRHSSYYSLIFYGFIVLGLIAATRFGIFLIQRIALRIGAKYRVTVPLRRRLFAASLTTLMVLSFATAYVVFPHKDLMRVDKEELAQFHFAKIINADKNPTLLNYGFLDGGFYMAAGILPTTKYFCELNMPFHEMTETQLAIVKNKSVQFIVLRLLPGVTNYGADVPYLLENYEFIEVVDQPSQNFTFCLFKAREDI